MNWLYKTIIVGAISAGSAFLGFEAGYSFGRVDGVGLGRQIVKQELIDVSESELANADYNIQLYAQNHYGSDEAYLNHLDQLTFQEQQKKQVIEDIVDIVLDDNRTFGLKAAELERELEEN